MATTPEDLYGDIGPAALIAVEKGPVQTVMFEAKDIALAGLNFLRQHPAGSIEVGGLIAGIGAIVGAVALPRLLHGHSS